MLLVPTFFKETDPKFLDQDYKTEHASKHVAKFCGDRPIDLEDLALKKNN